MHLDLNFRVGGVSAPLWIVSSVIFIPKQGGSLSDSGELVGGNENIDGDGEVEVVVAFSASLPLPG